MDYKDYQSGATPSHFLFKARTNLIEVLISSIKQPHHIKILDLGAGTGENIQALHKFGAVHAVDINQHALDLIPNNLVFEKKQGDACAIPYPNGHFDVVVAFDVLEHIQDDSKMVAEVTRVLKKDGFFIFTVPAYNALYSAHDKALDHYRRYNASTLKSLLRQLAPIQRGAWFFSLFPPVALIRLITKSQPARNNQAMQLPRFINTLFYQILNLENKLIARGIRFPFGLTKYGIYQKKN
jgi:SAM-dependent methyltransferase